MCRGREAQGFPTTKLEFPLSGFLEAHMYIYSTTLWEDKQCPAPGTLGIINALSILGYITLLTFLGIDHRHSTSFTCDFLLLPKYKTKQTVTGLEFCVCVCNLVHFKEQTGITLRMCGEGFRV